MTNTSIQSNEVKPALHAFITDKLLDGEGEELDEHTPLLEWGVIDSIAMVSLLDFIKTRFGVAIPDDEVSPRNFQSIAALERLILRQLGEGVERG